MLPQPGIEPGTCRYITDQMSVLTNQVHLKIQFRHRFHQKCPFTDSLHRLGSRFARTSSVPLEKNLFKITKQPIGGWPPKHPILTINRSEIHHLKNLTVFSTLRVTDPVNAKQKGRRSWTLSDAALKIACHTGIITLVSYKSSSPFLLCKYQRVS